MMQFEKVHFLIRFKKWRFLQLSVFLILMVFLSPLISEAWLAKLIFNFIFINSILVLFSTESRIGRHRKLLLVLWCFSAMFSFSSVVLQDSYYYMVFECLELLFTTIMLSLLIFDILYYVLKEREITIDSVFAALSVYLIIATLFALFYSFLYTFQPDSFHFATRRDPALSSSGINSNMFYFSMVTIATLGYGDIVPVTDFGRNLAVLEAVIGQFFVAVVVAMLVGKLIVNFDKVKE
jgi:voltage-gated potassium channel